MELTSRRESVEGFAPVESQRAPTVPREAVLDGARLAALQDLGLLDTEAEEQFDRYTRLATDLLGVPVALVSLVAADRQFFKSQAGGLEGDFAGARQTPLSHSFCQHAVATGEPFIVHDAREHPLVADNLAVRDLGVIAYAGMPLVLSDGNTVGAFCAIDGSPREWSPHEIRILRDLAAAVTAHLDLRKALADQGLYDRLTGLPNRLLLCAQADQLLAATGPAGAGSVAAVVMGLDGFGLVNDAYGAVTADRVLHQVGERLAAAMRGGDVLGRLRGDTFAVVGRDMGDERAVIGLARRLQELLSAAAFEVDGCRVGLTATLGLATGSPDVTGADLLSHADDTMNRGKASGGAARMATPDSAGRATAQLELRTALGGALDRSELHVVYQPIVDFATEAPVGFEALARWTSPELGRVSPADFIPVAERTGAIVKIGEWVLRSACAQVAEWRREGVELYASVNVAPLQLGLANLSTLVESVLAEHELPASALVLELTEGVLIGAGAVEARNLRRIRELGVRISLDDFGTGYSALGYLKRLPIDVLKIDRTFVEAMEDDRQGQTLVEAILALARGLDLDVVAEGVETPGQRELLRHLGCPLAQGYLFAPPRPASEISVAGSPVGDRPGAH